MHPQHAVPPHLLRLADAGDAKPAWITLLTTEHYTLGMQRAATISEVNGRASIFIGAVSAGLIALGFEGAGSRHSAGSTVFAALVLTSLLFLGLVTFGRCLQIAIDDWEFTVRIMKLRAAYAQLVPELAGLLAEADTNEAEVSMFAGRWQALQKMLSVAGSMAVISSVVLGADAGAVAYGLSASLLAALLAGAAAGTVLMFATARYQWGRWCVASSAPARTSALSAGPADLSVRLARTPSESQRRSMTCTSLILSGTTRNEEILNPRPPMRLPGHGSVCAIHTVVMTAERSGWGQSGERWARGVSRGGDDARSVPKITAGLGQRTLAAAAG